MQPVLERGLPFRFRAGGWSMSPWIKDGDVISITPLHDSHPATGDVIAFVLPNSTHLTVHRIVARRSGAFLIRGDNLPIPDGWIPAAALVGKVTSVERDGKRVSLGLGSERFLVALLSRFNLLRLLVRFVATILRPFRGRV